MYGVTGTAVTHMMMSDTDMLTRYTRVFIHRLDLSRRNVMSIQIPVSREIILRSKTVKGVLKLFEKVVLMRINDSYFSQKRIKNRKKIKKCKLS